jgi:hypothetical protein
LKQAIVSVVDRTPNKPNNEDMAQVLDEQIDLLGKQVDGFSAGSGLPRHEVDLQELETAVSLSINLFDVLRRRSEKACPPGQWQEEEARKLIPDYQRWLRLGDKVLASVRRVRAAGRTVEGVEAFMRAYLECKPIATDFDALVASYRRWQSGDRSGNRSLADLLGEALC